MRSRILAVAALLVVPSVMTAQQRRIPVPTRGTVPPPAELPPAAPEVGRALELKRSQWSVEGYSLLSAIAMPVTGGGSVGYTTIGTGLHGGYRLTDRWTSTFDITASPFGGTARSQTLELGARYTLPAWDRGVRPYFDMRADYMDMRDVFQTAGGVDIQAGQYARASRGLGFIGGAGLEIPFSNSFGISTGLTAVRNRMTAYEMSGTAQAPTRNAYWMTSVRWAVALRWNPTSLFQAAQNPRQSPTEKK